MVKKLLLTISIFFISQSVQSQNIIDQLKSGEWLEIPNSRLSSVYAKPVPPNWSGQKSIVSAWCGGAYDTKRDKLIIWGGGHQDYSGNELYTFDVNTLKWERITEPSTDVGGDESTGYYPDGLPRSRHTYNQLQYLPNIDRFCSFGAYAMYPSAKGKSNLDAFNFDTKKWERRSTDFNNGMFSAYDPVTGHVFSYSYRYISEYDPINDAWIARGNQYTDGGFDYMTAAIDPINRKMVGVGKHNYNLDNEIVVWDISQTGTLKPQIIKTNGGIAISSGWRPGFEYIPHLKKFIGWNGGADLYTLDMSTEIPTWEKLKISSTNTVIPTQPTKNGTYGRFRYIPSKNCVIVVNSTEENVFVYKLGDAPEIEPTLPEVVTPDPITPKPTEPEPTQPEPVTPKPVDTSNLGSLHIILENTTTTAQTNVPFTFGQVFKKGELNPVHNIYGVTSDKNTIPLQVDVKAKHSDGSVRHALLSGILPRLDASNSIAFELKTSSTETDMNLVSISEVVNNNFNAEVTLTVDNENYSAKVLDYLSDTSIQWLKGSTVSEWVIFAPLKNNKGIAHPHLNVQYNVRAYRISATKTAIRVNYTIENNWTYEANPRNFTYAISLLLNGKTVYSKSQLQHYHHARWRKVFWSISEPDLTIKHNTKYLIETGAVPSYNDKLDIPDTSLSNLKNRLDKSDTEPMGNALIYKSMPDTGGRFDIGPLPDWAAFHLLTMDKRALDATLKSGESAASFPIHYRDKNTNLPASVDVYPYISLLGNKGDTYNPKTGQYELLPSLGSTSSVPYKPDSAHQPSLAYYPYLLTGDYFYMEELEFWNSFNIIQSNPWYRGKEKGLIKSDQVRGQAWSFRTLGQTAYILPDNHPKKSHYISLVQNNIEWYENEYVNNPNANKLGWINPLSKENNLYNTSPWMDDFFTWSVGCLKDLDFDTQKILAWKSKYPVNRMINPAYSWIIGAPYRMQVKDDNGNDFINFRQAYEATLLSQYTNSQALINANYNDIKIAEILKLKLGEMTGYANSTEGYPSNMQPALAVAVDSGIERSQEAWDKFMSRSVKPDYSTSPQFDIVPRFTNITDPNLSVADFDAKEIQFIVYPNPSQGSFSVHYKNDVFSADKFLTITDNIGRVLLQETMELQEGVFYQDYTLNNLVPGIYYISINGENQEIQTKKIIIR